MNKRIRCSCFTALLASVALMSVKWMTSRMLSWHPGSPTQHVDSREPPCCILTIYCLPAVCSACVPTKRRPKCDDVVVLVITHRISSWMLINFMHFTSFYRAACNADAVLWWDFCLSVRPSVCLSVTRVDCDKTEERSVQIYIPYERTFIPVLWEEEWLVGGDPFYLKFWVNRPPLERNRRLSTNNRS